MVDGGMTISPIPLVTPKGGISWVPSSRQVPCWTYHRRLAAQRALYPKVPRMLQLGWELARKCLGTESWWDVPAKPFHFMAFARYFYIINSVAMITVYWIVIAVSLQNLKSQNLQFPYGRHWETWLLFFQDPHVAPPCFTDEAASSMFSTVISW